MPMSQGLAPLPPNDRALAVMRAVSNFIAKSGLKAGDRLPTERQLMAQLAVGRSTVREIIRQLQGQGVVESRRGDGTYLLRPTSVDAIHIPLFIPAAPLRDRLLQTVDVRRGQEVQASALAALRATAADLAGIEARLDQMERVHLAGDPANHEDLAFHLAIYDATHNPMFRQLLEQIREAFASFWSKPFDRQDFAGRSFPFHRKLFDAIRARNAAAANRHTLSILAIVEEDIKEMSH